MYAQFKKNIPFIIWLYKLPKDLQLYVCNYSLNGM